MHFRIPAALASVFAVTIAVGPSSATVNEVTTYASVPAGAFGLAFDALGNFYVSGGGIV